VLTVLPADFGNTTVEFKLNLVQPMSSEIREVRAAGERPSWLNDRDGGWPPI
jgi:hypothetical protein